MIYGLKVHGIGNKKSVRETVEKCLHAVGLLG